MTRTAIVTTFRGGHGMVDAFARYHLAMGFDWIFLFHDEPGAPRPTVAAGASGLVVNARDEDLYRRWRDTPLYRTRPDYVEAFLEREVMIRQILNAEVAIELSLERGIDWLLHIDIDELFYSPDKSVSEHFDSLTEAGYSGMRYLNYEGAPERGDLTSGFHDVTLFKKSPRMCAGGSRATSVTTVPCLQSFRARSRQLFHYYANGKSAARVTHGLTTHGVHGFRAQPCGETSTPAILHYPCCTFDVFWEKYQMLGSFDNKWFGNADICAAIGLTHLLSRDVVMAGNKDAARQFYEQRFVLRAEDAHCLLQHGLATRIDGPAQMLRRLSAG